MATESVNCVVTSPPYYALRDYGTEGQIGLEASPAEYVEKLVQVFREVSRVLRDDGTVWLNLGDSYAAGGKGGGGKFMDERAKGAWKKDSKATGWRSAPEDYKSKDLLGIPWRVAFALQADGWYLRQDIIWAKPNPMPESVKDRCTKSHEYIFLLAKSKRYYYDNESVREKTVSSKGNARSFRGGGAYTGSRSFENSAVVERDTTGNKENHTGKRNRRSVWTVSPRSAVGAHFAVFPPELITPCVIAGCPPGGKVLDPFNGSGTTGVVAGDHGRDYVGIEINPEYVEMSKVRLRDHMPLVNSEV